MRSPVSLARLVSVCAAVALTACGTSPGHPIPGPTLTVGPVPAVLSTDLAAGPNRFVFALFDGRTGRSMAAPGANVRVSFYDLARSRTVPAAEGDGMFEWIEPDREGAYVVAVELTAGAWEAEIRPEGARVARVGFRVLDRPRTPRIGAKAPQSFTRTLRDVRGRLEELSSDPAPLARFYRTSILQALTMAIPFVVVFGSPRHCSSTGCGHMLGVTKHVAGETTDLTFIHVETYRDVTSATPHELDPAIGEWGLPSDPWLFVVNARGRVVAKFERVVQAGELRAAIASLYSGG